MINQTFQFVTDGDYINFFVNNQICKRLAATSQAVNWVYDEEEGIIFTVNGAYCRTRNPEDISFDGTPLTTKEDFVTAIKAMFPVYAGGAGPGGNTIYTGDGSLAGARLVDLNSNTLNFQQGGNDFLSIDPTAGAEATRLQAFNTTNDDNNSTVELLTQNTDATFIIQSDFNDGVKTAQIQRFADASSSSITSTADSHTFIAGGETNGSILINDSYLRAFDPTNDDNIAIVRANVGTDDANFILSANFNDGVKAAQIVGTADASSSSITSTADSHIFIGVQEFADNAAASGAGLVVGTIYRTGDNLKIVH